MTSPLLHHCCVHIKEPLLQLVCCSSFCEGREGELFAQIHPGLPYSILYVVKAKGHDGTWLMLLCNSSSSTNSSSSSMCV